MHQFAEVSLAIPVFPHDRLFDYRIPEELLGSIRPGQMLKVPFRNRESWALVMKTKEASDFKNPEKIKSLINICAPEISLDTKRLQFFKRMSEWCLHPIGECIEAAFPASVRGARKELLEKDISKILDKHQDSPWQIGQSLSLNEEQDRVVRDVVEKSQSEELKHLIWGVTGSGKTEVYLQLIERICSLVNNSEINGENTSENSKGALVLVPEIALTPQLRERFEQRFPGQIALFHSSQKPSELRREWLATALGKKRIAIGARSALFAPVQNLSLMIIDEEHDASYKQEERLRYHARDLAVIMSDLHQCPLVLGSATPSAEAISLCRRKQFHLHTIKNRAVGDAKLPSIEIVDLKEQRGQQTYLPAPGDLEEGKTAESEFLNSIENEFEFISPQLHLALQECFDRKEQAILFLNRRGLGKEAFCFDCGESQSCPHCQVSLTPHNKKLLCHFCGFERAKNSACDQCASKKELQEIGFGTELVESALKILFPTAKSLRLDRDVTEKKGELERVIGEFKEGNADFLIGTQMVAKGHDFPNVSLVGILLADLGMGVPDFRATERNLQLLLQVCGRAGRAEKEGHVVLQCLNPSTPIYDVLQSEQLFDSYENFIDSELEDRSALNYPPFGQLALLHFHSLDLRSAEEASGLVANALKKIKAEGFEVRGPSPSPVLKIRNRFRYQLFVKSTDQQVLRKSLLLSLIHI